MSTTTLQPPLRRPGAFSRRQVLASAAGASMALVNGWPVHAISGHHTSRTTSATPSATPAEGGSWLLVVPDANDTGWISGHTLAMYGPDGAMLDEIDLGSGIEGEVVPTGDPRLALAATVDGFRLVSLDPPRVQIVDFRLSPDAIGFVNDPRGAYGAGHARWSVVHTLVVPADDEVSPQVALIDHHLASGIDLWPVLDGGGSYAPSVYRFSASGDYLTAWSDSDSLLMSLGDLTFGPEGGAWLVATSDPATARVLNGARSDWLGTAAHVSEDDSLVAYTAYSMDDGSGHVYLEPVEGGAAIELDRGTPWSRSVWLPGNENRLVTMGADDIAIHTIDASGGITSDALTHNGAITESTVQISADGRYLVAGSRTDPDALRAWQWLDLVDGSATALPDLDGLTLYRTSSINVLPRWLMFGPDSPFGYDRIVGLDLETGVTSQLIELATRPDKIATSADGRIALLGTTWEDSHPARLADLSQGQVTPLRVDRTRMIRSGVVSPDGSRAAIHAVANSDHALEVLLIDTADPTDPEPLSTGAAVLWTAAGEPE